MKRTSIVQFFHGETLLFSSVLQIGDSQNITSRARVLAVQRQYELFFGNEGESSFPIFTKPIPKIQSDRRNLSLQTLHQSPVISVRSIRVIAVSTAGVVHIGSTSTVDAEARIKNIRQLAPSTMSPLRNHTAIELPAVKEEK
jgi:spore germination protein PE